ncbi:MAG: hypothetical protein ABID35_05240 [Candidatus Margulisiibacteriota bacterium]
MGAILFVILRLIGLVNTPMDLPILCALISLDSIGVPAVLKLIRK